MQEPTHGNCTHGNCTGCIQNVLGETPNTNTQVFVAALLSQHGAHLEGIKRLEAHMQHSGALKFAKV